MNRHLVAAALAALVASVAIEPAFAHGPRSSAQSTTITAHRVLVADATDPIVHVVDLDSGLTLATYRVRSPRDFGAVPPAASSTRYRLVPA